MEFRFDFFFRFFMDVVFYIIQFLFFGVIYLHTDLLGGWNQEQMTVFVAGFIFVDALHMTLFASNGWWFPIYINRGDLDYHLTRPVSTFFFICFKEFAANSFLNLILASSILIYALISYSAPLSLIKLFVYFLLLLNGTFLYFMVMILFLIPVFWNGSPRGFIDVFFSAEKIYQRPDGIFHGLFKRFFITILPFSVVASYPTRFLIDENWAPPLIEIVIASIFIYILVMFFWKLGLKNYSSASS
tara:strand:+ start:25044 stop:25775 length:732 start_codon:yes stop_codon:yes gene_type:complete